uniref:Uncharacterized protein n=1 Tax=Lotharella oceanica TaxID=641309 RepID=A0A7S2TFJ9_9EUKA|mmetsp:Transcript_11650/g.22422  ORF Transcript_11650/g.22422 Transcript_11650/m.22422 type:complete len:196 (+) Transcript_11650:565-1152(+)
MEAVHELVRSDLAVVVRVHAHEQHVHHNVVVGVREGTENLREEGLGGGFAEDRGEVDLGQFLANARGEVFEEGLELLVLQVAAVVGIVCLEPERCFFCWCLGFSPAPMSTSAKPNANSSSESSTRWTPSLRMRSYQAWTFPAKKGFCFMISLPKAAWRKGRASREQTPARAIGCSVAALGSVILMTLPKSSTPAM